MWGKIPQDGNVGALHDSKLQKCLIFCSLTLVHRVYTDTLLDQEVATFACKERLIAQ